MNVGENTTLGNRDARHELVQFFIIADCQLHCDMAIEVTYTLMVETANALPIHQGH
jgi:hypothetical protein